MRYFAYRLPSMEPLSGDVQLDEVTLSRGFNVPGELRGVMNRETEPPRVLCRYFAGSGSRLRAS